MPPHRDQPVTRLGADPRSSRAAMLMLHGRNAGPENILQLADHFRHPDVAFVAPAAAGKTWYPYNFMVEVARNQPDLDSALGLVDRVLDELESEGVPRHRTIVLGFSQGACLASEYASRHPGRFGGIVALSGGLIGPAGTRWETPGDFGGTRVFLGCSDVDAHVPQARVDESAAVFAGRGAEVTERIYPGMGHLVNQDELEFVRNLLERVTAAP